MRKISGFYPLWRWSQQLELLNKASQEGWQLKKIGLFSILLEENTEKTYEYRLGASQAPKGSASHMEYRLLWQRAGWELSCSRGPVCYFRGPVQAKSPKDGGIVSLLARRIHRLEIARLWMLGLSALCIVAGYATDLYNIIRLSVVPLAAALIMTWFWDKLQKAKKLWEEK